MSIGFFGSMRAAINKLAGGDEKGERKSLIPTNDENRAERSAKEVRSFAIGLVPALGMMDVAFKGKDKKGEENE